MLFAGILHIDAWVNTFLYVSICLVTMLLAAILHIVTLRNVALTKCSLQLSRAVTTCILGVCIVHSFKVYFDASIRLMFCNHMSGIRLQ